MHPAFLLFEDPEEDLSPHGFIGAILEEKWRHWGSELIGFQSQAYRSAYLSDNDDGLGLALLIANPTAENPEAEIQGVVPVISEGPAFEFELLDHELDPEVSGCGLLSVITARRLQLALSDSDYLEHRSQLRPGAHYLAHLCAWCGSVQRQAESFQITDGPALERERDRRRLEEPDFDPASLTHLDFSMASMRSLIPKEQPAWFEFITRIENLRETRLHGKRGWLFEGDIETSKNPDSPPLRARFGLMEHHTVDGYEPATGDLINGVAFLQALVKSELPTSDPAWADQPSESDYFFMDYAAFEEARLRYQDAPVPVRLTAALLAQNGWEITSPPGWDADPASHPRLLHAHRNDVSHLVALQVNDDPAPPHGTLILPLTITRQGDGHEIKIDHEHPAARQLALTHLQVWVSDHPH